MDQMKYQDKTLLASGGVGVLVDSAVVEEWDDQTWETAACWLAGQVEDPQLVKFVRFKLEQQMLGVFFSERLAGLSGMSFELLRFPEHSRAQINAAKAALRASRDVQKLSTYHVTRWAEVDLPAVLDQYVIAVDTICEGILVDKDADSGELMIYSRAEADSELADLKAAIPDDDHFKIPRVIYEARYQHHSK